MSIIKLPSAYATALLFAGLVLVPAAGAQSWQSDDGSKPDVSEGNVIMLTDESVRRSFTLEQLDDVGWSDWEDLSSLLMDIHTRAGIPAVAAAVVKDGRVVAHATVGTQSFGSDEPVGDSDRFHLGSVTKSFTATVIGKLVEQGKLSWGTTVGEVLEHMDMLEPYRAVTVEQLLQHRGGLPAYTSGRPPGHNQERVYSGSPTEKRAAFIADVLMQAPAVVPGQAMLYSNAGYTIAGHMAERVSAASWEDLVQEHVFDPLGMTSAGFGFPQAPVGHVGYGPEFIEVPMEAYPSMEIIAPAGNIHSSVADLARYAIAHLNGLAGRDGVLRSETIKRLHSTLDGSSSTDYASGWKIGRGANGEPMHSHGGTVAASFAEVKLYPESNMATIVLTTVSRGIGESITTQVARAMRERYAPAKQSGFVTANESGQAIDIVTGESTPAEDLVFWRIIRGLSESLNDEDRETYRSLFAKNYDRGSMDSMFDFMAAGVIPTRGGVRSFHDAAKPFRVSGKGPTTRTVVFHLENGYPGYLGIELDEGDKIVELSLFVKGNLCPNGADRRCKLITKDLDRDFR